MPQTTSLPNHLIGGNFLFDEIDPALIHTPEDRTLEDRLIAETAEQFMDREVFPLLERLEHQEDGLARKLFVNAARLGLLSVEMPEAYGGLGLGKKTAIGVVEQLKRLSGFGITCAAHFGIGSQPLAYFGTEAQKKKYLPKLIAGEWMAAYCLSESESGSDALGMKTTAVLSPDGKHYVLKGAKMWITNAAWADLFTVFAKVDGQHVTAFLVERSFSGVSTGREERKLGIKTSSTRRVILEDVKVPVDNVLGEVGKGAHIAFNILNFGRFGLGVGSIGGAKDQIRDATRYATERKQFGKPLVSFGLIRQKLAEMAAKTFAGESAVYRTGGMIDAVMATGKLADFTTPHFPLALDEFALECSILKVQCSEILFQVADESLQIHGGYGFTEEFSPARALRDSRINRIFEGTNEINRLVIPILTLRRDKRGRLPFTATMTRTMREISAFKRPESADERLGNAKKLLEGAKKLAFFLAGIAGERFGGKRDEDQVVLASWSDLVSEIYLGESAVLRAMKTGERDGKYPIQAELAGLFIDDSVVRMESSARRLLGVCAEPGDFPRHLETVRRVLSWTPFSSAALHAKIAEHMITRGGYPA